jgi:hypothetical protein
MDKKFGEPEILQEALYQRQNSSLAWNRNVIPLSQQKVVLIRVLRL